MSIFYNNSTEISSPQETCLFQESLELGKPRAVASYHAFNSSPSLQFTNLGSFLPYRMLPSNVVDILLFTRLLGEQSWKINPRLNSHTEGENVLLILCQMVCWAIIQQILHIFPIKYSQRNFLWRDGLHQLIFPSLKSVHSMYLVVINILCEFCWGVFKSWINGPIKISCILLHYSA